MTDHFINQLVADLSPKKSLLNWKLWMHCTACLFMIAAVILGFLGIRNDYAHAIQTGIMFWKPGIFFLVWFSSILLITDISRPAGKIKKLHLVPLALGASIIAWQFVVQINQYSLQATAETLSDKYAFICLSTIFIGSIIVMSMTWKFWLSKTASSYPTLLGFLWGLSAGSLSATAFTLYCNKDAVVYISVYYMLPIFALSFLGSILGKRFLRW